MQEDPRDGFDDRRLLLPLWKDSWKMGIAGVAFLGLVFLAGGGVVREGERSGWIDGGWNLLQP